MPDSKPKTFLAINKNGEKVPLKEDEVSETKLKELSDAGKLFNSDGTPYTISNSKEAETPPQSEKGAFAKYAPAVGEGVAMALTPWTKLAYDHKDKFPTAVGSGLMGLGAGADLVSNMALMTPAAPIAGGVKGLGMAANAVPKAFSMGKNLAAIGVEPAKAIGKSVVNSTLHRMPFIKGLGSNPYANSSIGNKMYEFGRSGANIEKLNALKETTMKAIEPLQKIPKNSRTAEEALKYEKLTNELEAINKALEYGLKDMEMTNAGQLMSMGIMGATRYLGREGIGATKDYAMDFIEGRNPFAKKENPHKNSESASR